MRVVAKMATFPAREGILQKSTDSLINQVDELQVYLNNYSFTPEYLRHDKISVFRDLPDIGDSGKVYKVPEDSNIFLVDDDIWYPPNYVQQMLKVLDNHHYRVVVGCHGATMINPVRNYFKDRTVLHFRSRLAWDEKVNILGTGTVAFNSNIVQMDSGNIKHHNMLDCHLGVHCQHNKIPMICVSRPANWLRSLPTQKSLWSSRGDGNIQTKVINEIPEWKVF